MSTSREAFEAWYGSTTFFGRDAVWASWQASRKEALEEAIGTLDEFEPSMSEEGSSYYLRRIEMAIRALAPSPDQGEGL